MAGIYGGKEFRVGREDVRFREDDVLLGRQAFGLELREFGAGLGALAIDARFLDVEIAEFLLIGQVCFEHDQAAAILLGFAGEGLRELRLAVGVEGVLKFLDAAQAPEAIDDDLDEFAFHGTDGFEIFLNVGEQGGVLVAIVGGQEDGAAGEAGFHSILGRFGFAFWSASAGG